MKKIAAWIKRALEEIRGHDLPAEGRVEFIKGFKEYAHKNRKLAEIRKEIKQFTKKYPIPGI